MCSFLWHSLHKHHIYRKPTNCTKFMFDFLLIHFIHNYPQGPCWKLSALKMPIFEEKHGYTPSYPHYPHFYPRGCALFHGKINLCYFCTHFIKFIFSYVFLSKTIDKQRFLSMVLYRFNTFFIFLNCRKSFGYWLYFTELYVIMVSIKLWESVKWEYIPTTT